MYGYERKYYITGRENLHQTNSVDKRDKKDDIIWNINDIINSMVMALAHVFLIIYNELLH